MSFSILDLTGQIVIATGMATLENTLIRKAVGMVLQEANMAARREPHEVSSGDLAMQGNQATVHFHGHTITMYGKISIPCAGHPSAKICQGCAIQSQSQR